MAIYRTFRSNCCRCSNSDSNSGGNDHNSTSGDGNSTNPGTGGDEDNSTEHDTNGSIENIAVYELNATHHLALTSSYTPVPSNYSFTEELNSSNEGNQGFFRCLKMK